MRSMTCASSTGINRDEVLIGKLHDLYHNFGGFRKYDDIGQGRGMPFIRCVLGADIVGVGDLIGAKEGG